MSDERTIWTFGRPRHVSFLFLEFAAWKPEPLSELLVRFARKWGFTDEELEGIFREEELEHDAHECKYPDCLKEFASPPRKVISSVSKRSLSLKKERERETHSKSRPKNLQLFDLPVFPARETGKRSKRAPRT